MPSIKGATWLLKGTIHLQKRRGKWRISISLKALFEIRNLISKIGIFQIVLKHINLIIKIESRWQWSFFRGKARGKCIFLAVFLIRILRFLLGHTKQLGVCHSLVWTHAKRKELNQGLKCKKTMALKTKVSKCSHFYTKRIFFFNCYTIEVVWACEWSHHKKQVFQSGLFRANVQDSFFSPRPFSLMSCVNNRWQCFYFAKSSFNVGSKWFWYGLYNIILI